MIRLAARGLGATVVPRSSVVGPGSVLGLDTADDLPRGARMLRLTDDEAVHLHGVRRDPAGTGRRGLPRCPRTPRHRRIGLTGRPDCSGRPVCPTG
ncbi:hypothetical protein ACFV2H_03355 [Streptomyces sp. NPDC059629]|uniref:hypothetical protein n=1 Tax=Streptomyces sp. NPDC059629 TaxID=3346889 RepID=UPI00368A0F85